MSKPFNLERAQADDPIEFAAGHSLRGTTIRFIGIAHQGYYVVESIISGDFIRCFKDDLVMSPKTQRIYIAYDHGAGNGIWSVDINQLRKMIEDDARFRDTTRIIETVITLP